jgi:periplasmic divalent cation tolerance protein
MKDGFMVVFSTAPHNGLAIKIAKAMVKERLAACCNIVPIRSIYAWKGRVCDEREALCVFKTRASLYKRLEKRIREMHTYEVPEIVAFDIEAGYKDYLGWILESTQGR